MKTPKETPSEKTEDKELTNIEKILREKIHTPLPKGSPESVIEDIFLEELSRNSD